MKKILGLLASLSLICSTTAVVSCNILTEDGIEDCFDEYENNVTTKGSENYQWRHLFWLSAGMGILPSDDFPDSTAFFEKLNNSKGKVTTPEGEKKYDYTFLITDYESVNGEVINQMKQDLEEKDSGIYVFLNLPSIDLKNIKNELEIDFQFLFLIKKTDGKIINNNHNNWFFWYDCQITNKPIEDGPYFFNFQGYASNKNRVVTTVQPQVIN